MVAHSPMVILISGYRVLSEKKKHYDAMNLIIDLAWSRDDLPETSGIARDSAPS